MTGMRSLELSNVVATVENVQISRRCGERRQ